MVRDMHIGLFDIDWRGHHTPYVKLLSRYFISQGHQVTFITDKAHKHLDELPESERFSINTFSFPGDSQAPTSFADSIKDQYERMRQLRTAIRIANQAEFDVLHLLCFDRTQIPLRLATLSAPPSVPIIATLHRDAFVPNKDDGFFTRAISHATARALDSTIDNGTLDVLTVHSDAIRNRIVGFVPSATTSSVRTIPAPTPAADIASDVASIRDRLGLPLERDIALFFGGLRHEKGPDVLAKLLQQVSRPLSVVFAGEPADFSQADIDAWSQSLHSSVDIISRLEYIPEEEVDLYFAAADVTILPYRRSRGISGPLRRSAMVNTPVIGTTGTDVGRLIENHQLGATFDPESPSTFIQALKFTLTTGPELRSSLETFASSRHWEHTGATLVEIYQNILTT